MENYNKQIDNERGATTIEASVVVLPFFLIIFGIVQMAFVAFEAMSLQYTLNKAARWGTLGYTVENPLEPGTQLARGASINQQFEDDGGNFLLSTDDVKIFYCPVAEPACLNEGNPPGSQQWMVIRAEKPVTNFLGIGPLAVSATVLAMNEPF